MTKTTSQKPALDPEIRVIYVFAVAARLLIISAMLMFLSGCGHGRGGGGTPIPPRTDPCPARFACDAGTAPSSPDAIPAPDLVDAAVNDAVTALRARVDSGEIKLKYPVNWDDRVFVTRTIWRACPWYVANPDSDPNGVGGPSSCARGQYDIRRDTMIICTQQGVTQTLNLVRWEARNRFLVVGGRRDLAY